MNYDFARLNTKVPFDYDSTAPSPFVAPFFISLFSDNLVARYYNRVYALGSVLVLGLAGKPYTILDPYGENLDNLLELEPKPTSLVQQ